MGLVSNLLRGGAKDVADATVSIAEAFRPNATRQMELGHKSYSASLSQYGSEFQYGRQGFFDRIMNGLNRLPRPMLALGTLGLFGYAMIDPLAFSDRMKGLAYVPEPLWWLLGAIVSFYFGARELHYKRDKRPIVTASSSQPTANRALDTWRSQRGG